MEGFPGKIGFGGPGTAGDEVRVTRPCQAEVELEANMDHDETSIQHRHDQESNPDLRARLAAQRAIN